MPNLFVEFHDQCIKVRYDNKSSLSLIKQALNTISFSTDSTKAENAYRSIVITTKSNTETDEWTIHDQEQSKTVSGDQIGDFVYQFSDSLVFNMADKVSTAYCIHAATVIIDGYAILLAGPSGAGKSTYASWLVAQGAHYLTDEMSIITHEGLVKGFSRPIQIKQYGLAAVEPLIKQIDLVLSGRSVTGIPAKALNEELKESTRSHVEEAPLGLIIFPKYGLKEPYQLATMSPAEAGLNLMASYVNAKNFPNHGFNELMKLVEPVRSYTLTYSSFADLNYELIRNLLPTK